MTQVGSVHRRVERARQVVPGATPPGKHQNSWIECKAVARSYPPISSLLMNLYLIQKRVRGRGRTRIRENEPGRFVILKTIFYTKVGYALKTTIRVDPEAKQIVGYVTRYHCCGRRQLTIYEYGSQATEVHISPENVVMRSCEF